LSVTSRVNERTAENPLQVMFPEMVTVLGEANDKAVGVLLLQLNGPVASPGGSARLSWYWILPVGGAGSDREYVERTPEERWEDYYSRRLVELFG
jgi:hypothetical protein